jgi:hypothetical protein
LEIRVPEELVVESPLFVLVLKFPPELKLDELFDVEPKPPIWVDALDPAKRTFVRLRVPSPCRPNTSLFGSTAL